MNSGEKNSTYIYSDLLSWEDGDRYELIDGTLCPVENASRIHQTILLALSSRLLAFLEGKKCKVFCAPFPVRLFENMEKPPENINTVLLPDILVVCDETKLDDHGCKGAPDLVIEILSPSTRDNDEVRKWMLYEKAGVREYWVLDPERECVLVYLREGSRFGNVIHMYRKNDRIPVHVLNGCVIDLQPVFQAY